jgi:ubiquinone/menaquinone biosynthesis C-methylase UbiE
VAADVKFFPELEICHEMPTVEYQYMNYPYPPRDPQDEKKRLIQDPNNSPMAINHYVYGGKKDFPLMSDAEAEPFRILVAGGGTGDATTMYAQTFKNAKIKYEIVHVDMSEASLNIARKRVEMRGLKKYVKYVEGSLLDVASMNIGTFDFVDCVGVLHHLVEPRAGLRALSSVLKEDGGMLVMVYGALGRHGVYHFQDMFRLLKTPIDPSLAREMIDALPDSNWLKKNPKMLTSDIQRFGDNGIVDLLLHQCDSSYRVPEVIAFADSAGLELLEFSNQQDYDVPATLTKVPEIKSLLSTMHWTKRAAFAELAKGDINKQSFYMTKRDSGQLSATSPLLVSRKGKDHPVQADTIICRHDVLLGTKWQFPYDILSQAYANPTWHMQWRSDNHIHRKIPAMAAASLEYMNCKLTVEEIYFQKMESKFAEGTVNLGDFVKEMRVFYDRVRSKYARYWFIMDQPLSGAPKQTQSRTWQRNVAIVPAK